MREVVEMFNFFKKKESPFYPCIECLVFSCCSDQDTCDQIIHDELELVAHFTKYQCCPDCGSKNFYEGPKGGMCTNMMCAECNHKFNIGPSFAQRI